MWQLLKDVLAIRKEAANTRKALRLLNKQNWSVEFLTHMLAKAARVYGSHLEMTIVSPNGAKIIVKSCDPMTGTLKDDDIFNHLDDEACINDFIGQVNNARRA